MALVRISRELLRQVTERVETMKRAELHALDARGKPHNDPALKAEILALAENHAWGEHLHLRHVVPDKWCDHQTRVDSVFTDGEKLFPEVMFEMRIVLPPRTSGYGYYQYNTDLSALTSESAAKIRNYFAEAAAIDAKFKAVTEQVGKFLRSCKSLNDAVKKYPDILLYVPQSYKDDLDRKVERGARSAKEEVDTPAIDTALITSVGVVAAITGA